jgi:hypothetical protein
MANFAEKNDVDISKLFNWGSEFMIIDSQGKEVQKIYIRIIGDADLNKARVSALRKSSEMRKKLRDPNSDERVAFIPEKESFTKDRLVENILATKVKSVAVDVVKDMDLGFPKELEEDATLEEQEEHQREIDSWETNRNERINSIVKEKIDIERTKIEAIPFDDLYSSYEDELVNLVCENEMYKSFIDWCTYFSCYTDKKFVHRTFKSFEEFSNIPTFIKEQLLKFYGELDINIDNLK